MYAFFPIWYLILFLVSLALLAGQSDPPLTGEGLAFLIPGLTLMFAAPLLMHYFGTRNSDDELSQLIDFLAKEADTRAQQGSQPPHPRQP